MSDTAWKQMLEPLATERTKAYTTPLGGYKSSDFNPQSNKSSQVWEEIDGDKSDWGNIGSIKKVESSDPFNNPNELFPPNSDNTQSMNKRNIPTNGGLFSSLNDEQDNNQDNEKQQSSTQDPFKSFDL